MCELLKKRNIILVIENKNFFYFDLYKLFSVLRDRVLYLFDIFNCIVKKKYFIIIVVLVFLYGYS